MNVLRGLMKQWRRYRRAMYLLREEEAEGNRWEFILENLPRGVIRIPRIGQEDVSRET